MDSIPHPLISVKEYFNSFNDHAQLWFESESSMYLYIPTVLIVLHYGKGCDCVFFWGLELFMNWSYKVYVVVQAEVIPENTSNL